MGLSDIDQFLGGDMAPAASGTAKIDEFLAQEPSLGQRVNSGLKSAHETVGRGLTYLDRGLLPDIVRAVRGQPPGPMMPEVAKIGGGMVTPESVNPVSRNLTEAGVTYGVPLGGKLLGGGGALARLTGGLIGGSAGSVMEGKNPVSLEGAKSIAAPLALGEVMGYTGPRLAQMFPGVKSAISESNSLGLLDTFSAIDPELGKVIAGQQVKPTLKGGTTAAKIQQGIKSGEVQKGASNEMERQLGAVNMLAGAPKFNTPNLQQAYESMPALEQQKRVLRLGPVDPAGFTLQQAQAIKGYIGDQAFGQSPQGQGVTPVGKQLLEGDIKSEIESVLSRGATGPNKLAPDLWNQTNRRYAGTMGLTDALSDRNAFQGLNNRILLNRNQLSDYLAQNREDLTARLGPKGYDAIVERVLGGAQPGTRDILTPGGGGVTDAFFQTFGRGQGGSPQLLGVPLRTALPNLGSQYTGRRPFSMPPQLQELFDAVLQRTMGGQP
jgi:hypothetical protein